MGPLGTVPNGQQRVRVVDADLRPGDAADSADPNGPGVPEALGEGHAPCRDPLVDGERAGVPVAYAHSREGQPTQAWEPLEEHLRKVAELAQHSAAAFDSAEWGRLAGLWHDIGKYRPEFQRRLRGSGEQAEHAGVGAALAASKGRDRRGTSGLPLAFVIAGHHTGLANRQVQGDSPQLPLTRRIDENQAPLKELGSLIDPALLDDEIPPLPRFLSPPPAGSRPKRELYARRLEFWIRFLFSAVVDADRLATEHFYEPERRAKAAPFDSIGKLRQGLDAHLTKFRPDTEVNRLRAQVLADCRAAAALEPGLFSLTAPTGAGKTLSAMAFALHHAERYGLRRVIVVVPYTSIIEQNAAVYRSALGEENVVEHHSALDEAKLKEVNAELELRRRLATENWDAPIIVTTTVQFFESLFSNHPSTCRKLHNIAGSVIILDEAQSLPAGYLHCFLDAMRELATAYRCSLVISTATQPALHRRDSLPNGLDAVREIVRDPHGLARALERIVVSWPERPAEPVPYQQLAREVVTHERVLVVVHLRKDARVVAQLLPPAHRYHLSALMCAAHRLETIARIRERLREDGQCRVVATQLVEAGVDLDFPVVYRAFAGLDSLAQAAGRCNREGRLSRGMVRVFRAETKPPAGVLRIGLECAEALLARYGEKLSFADGPFFDEYFRMLYAKCESDLKGVQPERAQLNFANVAARVRLIEDGFQHPVVVPWKDALERVRRFELEPSRETQRGLQPYIVQVRDRDLRRLEEMGAVATVHDRFWVLAEPYRHLYSEEFGLVIDDDAAPDPEALYA